ncbi:MAG: flagellar hook basal-body protein [Phycisphaeraceae bacterium]|nr:flagellar hook basal-body protein [Phycisphaeraceae bacterium]MCB9847974.1 flagellar hook basal-body protein [Phycisphaeraceae bacterium]
MSAGMYVSASGALTNMYRLDVASNNLANVNTTAFKQDFAYTVARPAERLEDSLFQLGSDELLDQLAGGVLNGDTRTDFSPGAVTETGNPLDAAIDGEGFFVADSGQGADQPWLTRDGRFTLSPDGELISATSGLPILSTGDSSISVNTNLPVAISPRGEVIQDGRTVGRLKLVRVPDPTALKKTLGGFFASKTGEPLNLSSDPSVRIRPESLEGSGVEPIKALMAVTSAGAGIRNNLQLMQLYDNMNNFAINRLGNVTG